MKIKGKEYNKKLNIGLIIIAIVLFAFSIIMKKYDEYIIAPVSFKVFYKSLVQLTICAILGIYYSFFYNKLNKVAVGILTILAGIILEGFFSGNEIMNNFIKILHQNILALDGVQIFRQIIQKVVFDPGGRHAE